MFKAGTKVRIRTIEYLAKKYGLTKNGYPKTSTQFNHDGLMDKYFGKEAIVLENGPLAKDIMARHRQYQLKVDGKEVRWVFSGDMLEKI